MIEPKSDPRCDPQMKAVNWREHSINHPRFHVATKDWQALFVNGWTTVLKNCDEWVFGRRSRHRLHKKLEEHLELPFWIQQLRRHHERFEK